MDTQTGTPRYQYADLDEAFSDQHMLLENRKFIRAFVAAIGIASLERCRGYIKASRAGGGPDLRIASDWTNGFVSREEAVEVTGYHAPWASDGRPGLWGVTHPVHGHGSGGPSERRPTSGRVCPVHNIELPLSGSCPDCED